MGRTERARLTFRQIEAFRAAAELSTATAAAHALGLGQPAVSRLLADLERRTGLTLFDRRGRGLALTPEGELLRQEVDRSFIGLDAIAEAAVQIRRSAAGLLRVAALQAYADGFVAEAAGLLLRDHPGLRLELQSVPKPELIRLLSIERFDLGIATLPVETPALTARPLGKRHAVLLLPDALLPPDGFASWAALDGLPIIALPTDAPYRIAFDARAAEHGIRPRIMAELRTQRAVARAALAGGGAGLVEDSVAREFDPGGARTRSLPDPIEWTLALLRPRTRRLSAPASRFAALLETCAAARHQVSA